MELLVVFLIAVVFLFAFVILFGAPYLPTLGAQTTAALDLLNLKKGQRLLDLGAGDGAVAVEALRRGLKVTAIELNPLLCVVIWVRTWRYRRDITIKCANFWTTQWGECDGIYVFLLDKYMERLDKYITQRNISVHLASYTFKIPNREVVRSNAGVYLYSYKASKKV